MEKVLFVISLAILATAFVIQSLGYVPCELCYLERIPYYVAIAFAAFAPRLRFLWVFIGATFLIGAGIAVYHVGLEQGIFALPACLGGPMAPAADFMASLQGMKVHVPCNVVELYLFGLSLSTWNIFSSLFLAYIAAVGYFKGK